MNEMKLLPIIVVLLSSCVHREKSQALNSTKINSDIYQRAVLTLRDDLPERIKIRMNQPFILAGEDVELLSQEFEAWLNRYGDIELVEKLKSLDAVTQAAIFQFIDTKSWKAHQQTLNLLQKAPKINFAARR
jgi:hypothetical protein